MNLRSLFLLLFAAALLPTAARSGTLNVPAQYPTIQAGVNAAANGDTVLVADGTYSGDGNRDIDFLGKNITVKSVSGVAKTIIDCGGFDSTDGSGNHRGFYIHSGETAAVISGFTVKNGYQSLADGVGNSGGGAIRIDKSSVTIRACTLINNTAYDGGAVAYYNYQASGPTVVSLIGCAITGNTGHDGGGICNRNYNYTAYTGLLTLTECTVSDNTAQEGGGVLSQNGSNSKTTLINCVVSGNTAMNGGGLRTSNSDYYNDGNGGATRLVGCTFAGNTVQQSAGGGGIDSYSSSTSPTTLTNCIVYANGTGQILNSAPTLSPASVTYSDVLGGYLGTGNIDADPLFVSAALGNFHLRPNSPCLGAGMSTGAPATDKDGRNRPTPPSIGAYELVPASLSHILWRNTDGTQALWTVQPDYTVTTKNYGPYAGWTAKAIADTPDGHTHLAWNHQPDGQVAVWDVAQDGSFAHTEYGPYAGWSATALSAGPDGRLHLLWNHSPDNQMALWAISPDGSFSYQDYGPYAGWTAKGVATGGDGITDVLWTNTDGAMSTWKVSEADGNFSFHNFGPYAGWTANAVAAGPDGLGSIAWSNRNGTQALWSIDFGTGGSAR